MTLDALDAILCTVAREHGFKPMQLLCAGRGRSRGDHWQAIHRAKRKAMARMRAAGASLPRIARVLGLRHHQPVIFGLRKHARECARKIGLTADGRAARRDPSAQDVRKIRLTFVDAGA